MYVTIVTVTCYFVKLYKVLPASGLFTGDMCEYVSLCQMRKLRLPKVTQDLDAKSRAHALSMSTVTNTSKTGGRANLGERPTAH